MERSMSTPVMSGREFLVNVTTRQGTQSEPVVTALSGGRFVVVWVDSSEQAPDTFRAAIRGGIYNLAGQLIGTEFVVNSLFPDDQMQPAIATLNSGGFVVTWRTSSVDDGDGNGTAIKAQRFDANGAKVGSEILVNQLASGSQSNATVAAQVDGGFAVTWQGAGVVGGALEDLGLRLFDANGVARGNEINWTGEGLSTSRSPVITRLGNGNLLVVYEEGFSESTTHDTDTAAIVGRIFNAAGSVVVAKFGLNTTATDRQTQPDVISLAGGGFVATWTDNSRQSPDTNSEAIRGQVFTNAGVKVGSEFVVNTTTTNNQNEPDVTALSDGRFLIAWTDGSIGADQDIRVQLFNANGTRSGEELRVNSNAVAGNQINPDVTQLSDGRIVITWRDGPNGDDVFARMIDPRESALNFGGTGGNDIVFGTRFAETMLGLAGNDILDGGAGSDRIDGGTGADTLQGAEGNDTLFGNADNDQLFGWTGADLLWGGTGNDTLFGEQDNDVLLGEAGNDLLWGGDGIDTLYGWEGADTLLGEAGADVLFGEADNDLIFGWLGADVLWGGAGNDTLWGEQDNDTLLGEVGNDVLLGVDGNDVMYGWLGNDTLYGWTGEDVLFGEADNDRLFGENGNDTIVGGLGRDTMTGGAGADRFFNANFEIAAGEVDVITDYDATDRYLFNTGAVVNYFNFNAPGYGTGAGIHVTVAGGVFILDVFGATASQLQAQTQFF
jgi:Ca2+-binding RTX toxin-like protein